MEQWRGIFDPARQKLFEHPTAASNSRSYVLAGDKAREAFEQVAERLIQRVRELLGRRRFAHHIGTPESCATLLVDPLCKKALDSVDKVAEKALRGRFPGYQNFIGTPLDKVRQKIENRAALLKTAIAAEVTMRLEEFGPTRTTTSGASSNPPGPHPTGDESPDQRARRALEALDLHPEISKASDKLFRDGHYTNAVEDACKALDALVQDKSGRHNLSGTDLMQTVFSPKAPVLRFSNLTTETERSEQQGMMFLYAGAMLALRNPRAHKLTQDGPEQALEYIGFLSLLAKSLDRTTT